MSDERLDLSLLKFNYQNLHTSIWENHKLAWTATGIFIPVLFGLQGYLAKEYMKCDIGVVLVGVLISELLLIVWRLMMAMLILYNYVRIERLREVEDLLSKETSSNAIREPIREHRLHHGPKFFRIDISPRNIYNIIFGLVTAMNVSFIAGKEPLSKWLVKALPPELPVINKLGKPGVLVFLLWILLSVIVVVVAQVIETKRLSRTEKRIVSRKKFTNRQYKKQLKKRKRSRKKVGKTLRKLDLIKERVQAQNSEFEAKEHYDKYRSLVLKPIQEKRDEVEKEFTKLGTEIEALEKAKKKLKENQQCLFLRIFRRYRCPTGK